MAELSLSRHSPTKSDSNKSAFDFIESCDVPPRDFLQTATLDPKPVDVVTNSKSIKPASNLDGSFSLSKNGEKRAKLDDDGHVSAKYSTNSMTVPIYKRIKHSESSSSAKPSLVDIFNKQF